MRGLIHAERCLAAGALALLLVASRGLADEPAVDLNEAASPPLKVSSGYGIRGLVLWLAADSGVKMDADNNVSALRDRTGNFTLTAGAEGQQPTLVPNAFHGHPVLHFNSNQSLVSQDDFGGDLDHDMTFLVVARTPAPADCFQYPIYLGQNQTSHANRALTFHEGKIVFDGQWVTFEGPPVVTNAFVTIGASVNHAVTSAAFYKNGARVTRVGLSNIYGAVNFENLSSGVSLGAASRSLMGWTGDIAEVLVFDRQLSDAEMKTLWASLSAKYDF